MQKSDAASSPRSDSFSNISEHLEEFSEKRKVWVRNITHRDYCENYLPQASTHFVDMATSGASADEISYFRQLQKTNHDYCWRKFGNDAHNYLTQKEINPRQILAIKTDDDEMRITFRSEKDLEQVFLKRPFLIEDVLKQAEELGFTLKEFIGILGRKLVADQWADYSGPFSNRWDRQENLKRTAKALQELEATLNASETLLHPSLWAEINTPILEAHSPEAFEKGLSQKEGRQLHFKNGITGSENSKAFANHINDLISILPASVRQWLARSQIKITLAENNHNGITRQKNQYALYYATEDLSYFEYQFFIILADACYQNLIKNNPEAEFMIQNRFDDQKNEKSTPARTPFISKGALTDSSSYFVVTLASYLFNNLYVGAEELSFDKELDFAFSFESKVNRLKNIDPISHTLFEEAITALTSTKTLKSIFNFQTLARLEKANRKAPQQPASSLVAQLKPASFTEKSVHEMVRSILTDAQSFDAFKKIIPSLMEKNPPALVAVVQKLSTLNRKYFDAIIKAGVNMETLLEVAPEEFLALTKKLSPRQTRQVLKQMSALSKTMLKGLYPSEWKALKRTATADGIGLDGRRIVRKKIVPDLHLKPLDVVVSQK